MYQYKRKKNIKDIGQVSLSDLQSSILLLPKLDDWTPTMDIISLCKAKSRWTNRQIYNTTNNLVKIGLLQRRKL